MEKVVNNDNKSSKFLNNDKIMDLKNDDKNEPNPKSPDDDDSLYNNALEKKFYKSFMSPMLSDLEEKIGKNNEILDRINKKWEEEREEKRKVRLTKHIPEELKGKGVSRSDIMANIENLIIYENYAKDVDFCNLVKPKQRQVDGVAELAILAQSLAAYISLLEANHVRHLSNHILSNTTKWLCRLFRFENGVAYFNDDERECLVRIARLSLLKKFPTLTNDGFDALHENVPVFYISAAARPGLAQYLCAQLSIPLWCVNTISCLKEIGSQYKMDPEALEAAIERDLSEKRMPVMVISYAGTPLIGQVDDLKKIQEICSKNKIWLHVDGINLATLVLYSVPTSVNPAKTGDSISLNLSSWFGLPSTPHCILYKEQDSNDAHAVGLIPATNKSRLSCLGIWMCLQDMGHDGMVKRVQDAINIANYLVEKMKHFKHIRHLSKRIDQKKTETPDSIAGVARNLMTKAINALMNFEIENPTVVFQYYNENNNKIEDMTEEDKQDHLSYMNSLNFWIVENMKKENCKVFVSASEVENAGVCIRFSPLETLHALGTTANDIDELVLSLEKKLPILDATFETRQEFKTIVNDQDNLNLIKVDNWAGLGAVQFVPAGYINRQWDKEDERNINLLNINLLQELKSKDTAFSLGFDENQTACVRFGLITNLTDLEDLIGLVVATGYEIEEASRYIEVMADVVKQGIVKAEHELMEEYQKKIGEEGALRQLPFVSGLMNWWSPPPKDSVKGRSFSLNSGKIASTEQIYKYKMQVKENEIKKETSNHAETYKSILKPHKQRKESTDSIENDKKDDIKHEM